MRFYDKYTKLLPWLFVSAFLIILFLYFLHPSGNQVSGVAFIVVVASWLAINGFGFLMKLYLQSSSGQWPDTKINWALFLTFSLLGMSFVVMCIWLVIALIK